MTARHAAVLPEHVPELAVEVVDRPAAVHRREPAGLFVDRALRLAERGVVGADQLLAEQRREVVADGGREHEVAVGESLHQRARTQPVGAVVGEVRLAEHVEPRDVAHEVVVDPQPAHRVVDRGVDAHGHLVRVLVGDAVVHLDEVAVALLDDVVPESLDRVAEVEVHTVLQWTDTTAGVDLALRGA